MSNPTVVELVNVSVRYETPNYKSHTFKEFVFNKIRGLDGKQVIDAVKNATFSIKAGECVAFLGHNGSGKSTLLRVVAGILPINKEGKMNVVGRIAPMIEISAGFDPELSGYENIYLSCTLMGLSTFEIDSRIKDIIEFSELQKFIDMPLKNYSSGMLARLGFACATAVDPDIILADEVLAVGDANFELKCLDKIARLRESGTTVILVSHSQAAVEKFCSRGIVFYEGEIKCDAPIAEAVAVHNHWLEYRRTQH